MTMTTDGYCPHCGATRAGWAKFCGSCGKPYEAPVVEPVVEPAPIAAPAPPIEKRANGGAGLLAVLLVVGLGIGAYLFLNKGGVPSVSGANLPPSGTIWFGASFDPTTFELRERSSYVGAHSGFSGVAHLNRSVDGSQLSIRVSWNGSVVATSAAGWTGSGEVWGFSPGPLIEPGVWEYELVDVGGNELASGSVTAQ